MKNKYLGLNKVFSVDIPIYDIDLVGVSIIQTYRQQFAGLLKEKSFDEMFKQFKNQ